MMVLAYIFGQASSFNELLRYIWNSEHHAPDKTLGNHTVAYSV